MKPKKQLVHRLWYKAKLTPASTSIFTEAFYPKPKRGSGAQYVFFTQIDLTPTTHRIVLASRLEESGIRMVTHELAQKILIPMEKATKAEMATLNILSANVKA